MSDYTSAEVEGTDLEPRDVRALTEYLTVLEDAGRARGAADLYLVVSQSGREYLVDARTDACECPDAEHRRPDGGCKHVRRVAYATGARPVPALDGVDEQLGAHVDGSGRAVATDGGKTLETSGDEDDVTAGYTEHVEPRSQGGARYVRCEGCGREVLTSIGREQLIHTDGCPNRRDE